MNIALITNNYLPNKGGITNVMVNVSRNLTKLGERVFIFNKSYHNEDDLSYNVLSNDTTLSGIFIHNYKFFFFLICFAIRILFFFKGINYKDRIKLVGFYCFYLKFLVRRIISIRNLVKRFNTNKIDVILSGSANIPLFYSYILSKWFRIPMITIAHGDDFLVNYAFKIKTFILENIERIIVTNKIMGKLLLKIHNISPNKISIVNLGVDIENNEVKESILKLREDYRINIDDFIILTVSRFYPRKGFETVIRTVKLIIEENPNIPIKYIIIGDGEQRKYIENLIIQLKLEKIVILLGAVDDKTKNKYFKLSDIFVLVPEVKKDSIEGFGIVYLEANYFKLPVIGSRSGGVKLAIENGKSGFLVDPGDIHALKEKILALYNDKELCSNLGDYGHKRVVEDFNWKTNSLKYQIILQRSIDDYYNKNKF